MKKNLSVFFILIFLTLTLVFNFKYLSILINPAQSDNILVNDSLINEFLMETSYQNLKEFKNPFTPTNKIFYPFEFNFSLSDPSTSFSLFFLFLRPFFGSYQSLLLIVLISIFLSALIMYFLLQKMKINQNIAFISSLVYGFMPYLSYRINGHFTYTSLYLFPLLFLLAHLFVYEKKQNKKLLYSAFFGLVLAFTLLSNFQYFISAWLAIAFLIVYFLFKNKKEILGFLADNFRYIAISMVSFFILLTPWLIQVKNYVSDFGIDKKPGFGGAVELSADVLNFFIPSKYNPIYDFLISRLANYFSFLDTYNILFEESWGTSVYPGVIILLSVFYLIFQRKKINKKIWANIKPYLFTSIFFAILTLGPFLKIFNRWFITLEEGIRIYLPLPFLGFHYIPGLNSMRAPSRFTPVFVFFAVIAISYLLNYLYFKLKTNKNRIIFVAVLFIIFFIDQFYQVESLSSQKIPLGIYKNIENHSNDGAVLEIPFTVRDGFQYIGFVHALSPMKGALIHEKPVIGGYMARVPQKIFDYYKNLKFIGYVAKIIDKGNYNPNTQKPNEIKLVPFEGTTDEVSEELEDLNIRYIILKNNEQYTDMINNLIKQVGFKKTMEENNYNLYIVN